MEVKVSVIDIDAIPLDLAVQQQPIAALYLATVETLPDGREVVMPHYGEPVWQWFGKQSPTLAHGPREPTVSKGRPTTASVANVGERRAAGSHISDDA